jgi:hypothetical protein
MRTYVAAVLVTHGMAPVPRFEFMGSRLAAPLVRLYRRTGNRTVGAEHAAIAWEGLQSLAAAFAVVEKLAGVSGHGLNRLMAAFRASKR